METEHWRAPDLEDDTLFGLGDFALVALLHDTGGFLRLRREPDIVGVVPLFGLRARITRSSDILSVDEFW